MRRMLARILVGLIVLSPLAGCGPELSEGQLGEVEYTMPTPPAEKAAKVSPSDTPAQSPTPPAAQAPAKQEADQKADKPAK